jgi:hypothetical protein
LLGRRPAIKYLTDAEAESFALKLILDPLVEAKKSIVKFLGKLESEDEE